MARRTNANNCKSGKETKTKKNSNRREQPRKDSSSKRINLDNARKDRVERDIERGMESDSRNDISWYNRNPELLKAASTFPFASILGEPRESIYGGDPISAVSGIMVLPWSPALGVDDVAVNQAFNSMYSYIVHANSRNYSYSSADLGILCLAGIQVFSIISSMIRAYGTVKYYQERNYYFPEGLLKAMGFKYKNMRENLSKIWFDINNLIDQTRQIWVPDVLPIADRWYFMNSMMFTDAPDNISQTYLYVQDAYYIFSETGLKTGSSLIMIDEDGLPVDIDAGTDSTRYTTNHFNPASQQYDWSTWVAVAQAMIDALVQSEDRGIIFGDVLNAYGIEKIKALSSIDASFMTAPVYNAEVLTQIENYVPTYAVAKALGQREGLLTLTTFWGTNLYYMYNSNASNIISKVPAEAVLNFHIPTQPSPEMVTIATRLLSLGFQCVDKRPVLNLSSGAVNDGMVYMPKAVGTELPHQPIIYVNEYSPTHVLVPEAKPVVSYAPAMRSGPSAGNSPQLGKLMAFDWHPFHYVMLQDTTIPSTTVQSYDGSIVEIFGDYANYTFVNVSMMQKLHRACLFSLLGVPHM